ncbi:hypothetical protein GCM10025864_28010 [Luteimicrobium album]|uniref:Response regulatory domain-containing protein n=1 Tax=Luteimicrobium album TaxID=1054550 RepID=A0ABQ6I3J0_9MICO|nr:hypothetical protein GCM10025864_28010 [Luteimicrobium album]
MSAQGNGPTEGAGAGSGAPVRVALVDDQQLVRAGFRMVIDSQPDLEVVVEAGDGAQALRLLASHPVDVVLMDVRMPTLDGLSATAQLTAGAAETGAAVPRVIVLTTFDLDEYVLEAIRAGASGFLLKDAPRRRCSPRSGPSMPGMRSSRRRRRAGFSSTS